MPEQLKIDSKKVGSIIRKKDLVKDEHIARDNKGYFFVMSPRLIYLTETFTTFTGNKKDNNINKLNSELTLTPSTQPSPFDILKGEL